MGHLSGNGEKLDLGAEALGGADHHGQQIEEQGAVPLGFKGHELAAARWIQQTVQLHQIGGFAA